jgi:hypothetical protein
MKKKTSARHGLAHKSLHRFPAASDLPGKPSLAVPLAQVVLPRPPAPDPGDTTTRRSPDIRLCVTAATTFPPCTGGAATRPHRGVPGICRSPALFRLTPSCRAPRRSEKEEA